MHTRTHSNQFQARAVHGTKGQPATTLIAGTPIANARSSPILLSERPCAKTTTTTSHLTPRPHVLHYDQHAFCSRSSRNQNKIVYSVFVYTVAVVIVAVAVVVAVVVFVVSVVIGTFLSTVFAIACKTRTALS